MRFIKLAAIAIFSLPLFAFASIDYSVNQIVGSGSVVGTIQTDGTIGKLGQGNVTGWNLNITDGASTFDLIGGTNSHLLINGSLFSATATGLYFDFSGSNGLVLFQSPNIGSSQDWWCIEGVNSSCAGTGNSTASIKMSFQSTTQVQHFNGLVQVASLETQSVPEPLTLSLFGIGLLGLGIARRNKHNQ
ncbi:MAG: PEP-CTERM sorting domain-containing protein [Pseudomonadota bacterium]